MIIKGYFQRFQSTILKELLFSREQWMKQIWKSLVCICIVKTAVKSKNGIKRSIQYHNTSDMHIVVKCMLTLWPFCFLEGKMIATKLVCQIITRNLFGKTEEIAHQWNIPPTVGAKASEARFTNNFPERYNPHFGGCIPPENYGACAQ